MKSFSKYILILTMLLSPSLMRAQSAGAMISGNVYDDMGGVMMANVVEIDAANRIVAAAVTDINGNFSFRLVNPKDKIRVSYVGYATQTLAIKGTTYKIYLKSHQTGIDKHKHRTKYTYRYR